MDIIKKIAAKPMSNQEYHALPDTLGSSQARTILTNVLEYKNAPNRKPSENQIIGSYGHSQLLEPENTNKEFLITDRKLSKKIKKAIVDNYFCVKVPAAAITPKGAISTSKSALAILKNLKKETEGMDKVMLLTPEEYDQYKYFKIMRTFTRLNTKMAQIADKAIDKAKKFSNVEMILLNGYNEETFISTINGQKVKCRPDNITIVDERINSIEVVDLKFTEFPADMEHFKKALVKYDYHIQQAWYELVLESLGFIVERFRFLVVSTKEWSGVEFYELPEDLVKIGKDACYKAIATLAFCKRTNIWREGDFIINRGADTTLIEAPVYLYNKYTDWRSN